MEYVKKLSETGTELLGTSHRKPAVKNLVKEVQEGFQQYFSLPKDTKVVIGNGGATFVWDMLGTGLVEKASHHFVCGEFSQKWFKAHANIPWIEAAKTEVEFGQGVNPSFKEGFDFIACTQNETSTGVQMSQWPGKTPDNVILACDATSGAGQIAAPLDQVDFYYFSPQKIFAGEGGLFFAFANQKVIERAAKIAADKSRYRPVIMDWDLALSNSEKNQTYNTPCVSSLFYLNEQLKVMNALGFAKVQTMAQEKADLVYNWAESKDYLSPYIAPEFRSTTVATIDVDEKIPVDELLKKLRAEKVVYDIDAYRKLGRNQFRISLFHNVKKADLEKLTKLISYAVEA